MSVVMVGVDEMWDVALLKFIYEFTSSSLAGNVQEMAGRGMLEPQEGFGGVPRAAIDAIERMFVEVGQGANPEILKRELDRWGLFDFFEERFLSLFSKAIASCPLTGRVRGLLRHPANIHHIAGGGALRQSEGGF